MVQLAYVHVERAATVIGFGMAHMVPMPTIAAALRHLRILFK